MTAFAAEIPESGSVNFTFENDDDGFVPIFADYPAGEGSDEFYELESGLCDIPISGAGKGLYISGNNHSDDLFMGYYKELDGFLPNRTYIAEIYFRLATDADGGMIGIGGSPGSSVYVKCGITAEKPVAEKTESNGCRLNIDKGNQGSEGGDMKIFGTIEKHETLLPGKYEFNDYSATLEITADGDGKAYFIIGTDSGFEGTTSYYIAGAEVKWTEKTDAYDIKRASDLGIITDAEPDPGSVVTRLQFCEYGYNMLNSLKELPSAEFKENPFRDIADAKVNTLAYLGIVSGKGNGEFAPADKITREEAAAVLYRIAIYSDAEMPKINTDSVYADNGEISPWAADAVYALKAIGIMNGDKERFCPMANLTVKEAAAALLNLYGRIR